MHITLLALLTVLSGMSQLGTYVNPYRAVRFVTYDSNSTSLHVTPTGVFINDISQQYVYTPSTGEVKLTVPAGGEFKLSVTADQYNKFESSYTASSLDGAAVNLVKIQEETESSGTVTWNHAVVKDLDSHMYIYDGNGVKKAEVYYSRTSYSDEHTTVITTKDDTGSGSGETTTINPYDKNYKYHFYLYRYSSSGEMTKSDAVCNVTLDNKSYTVKIPTTEGEHRWWHIYDVINGEIVIVNKLTDDGE